MSQVTPTYPIATGKPEEPIVNTLISKYGINNISWPIVLSRDNQTIAYLYEKNTRNQTNSAQDSRPTSSSGVPSYFMDYTSQPRNVIPAANFLTAMVNTQYSCSYAYITSQQNFQFSTVDLDYVWNVGTGFKGFELTTFYVDFTDQNRALDLVSKMNRRPSWQGQSGAQAFHKIVDSAEDLKIDYYLVCVNTVSKVGSDIKTSGNVLYFRLDHDQIDRISAGQPPQNSQFCSFTDFLNWL